MVGSLARSGPTLAHRFAETEEKSATAPGLVFRGRPFHLGLIAAVSWIANYLHFTSFGLHADDWYYIAFPFLIDLRSWMLPVLRNNLRPEVNQGRPLQIVFGYTFAAAGSLANSLAVDYLISYLLFTGSAWMFYAILRRRFSPLESTLAALIFVLTPLHTLHQFLNGQFSFGPALVIVFGATMLYLRGRRVWAYLMAPLTLLCYESIFFLFLPAPLLRPGPLWKGRRREWITHLGIFGAEAVLYFVARSSIAETRIHNLGGGARVLRDAIESWGYHSIVSFTLYLYAAVRAREATPEAWFYAATFALILVLFLRKIRPPDFEQPSPLTASLGVAAGFLVCGYPLSYFFAMAPSFHIPLTDRETRISVAAVAGSSLLIAILLAKWIEVSRSRPARTLATAGVCAVLTILFLYSFVVQNDYVDDWREQRAEVAQILLLTPDASRGSVILLKRRPPDSHFFHPTLRGIGFEKTLFEWQFPHLCRSTDECPALFVVYSDAWQNHLRLDAEGFMNWTQPIFDGRLYPVSGRFRPGRFIVLDGTDPQRLIRRSAPIYADGTQIVQQEPAERKAPSFWASLYDSRFSRLFVPEFAWKPAR